MPKRFFVALCLTLASGFAPHAPRRPLARTPGQLSAAQIQETKAKFAKHEKIVAKMTQEERTDPQIMFDDLKDTANACPRVQRIALASGVTEKEVALFVAEFEGIRESTMRIAAGEDPDEVNQST